MPAIDPNELRRGDAHALLTSLWTPRAIALIGSQDSHGVMNLAPFSFATAIASRPMLFATSISDGPGGRAKDTLANIEATGVYTVNIVDEPMLEAMHKSSTAFPAEVSEFERVSLTPVAGERVAAPRVAESPASWEMELQQSLRFDEAHTTLVIGKALLMHVREGLVEDGEAAPEKLRSVGRLGKDRYAVVADSMLLDPV
jgi:flavin reductase (DIM6/NTAB) family NADH-FMN oxidoreductase RutF